MDKSWWDRWDHREPEPLIKWQLEVAFQSVIKGSFPRGWFEGVPWWRRVMFWLQVGSMRTEDESLLSYPFSENILSRRCNGSWCLLKRKTSFMQNQLHYTSLEPPSASGLYRPTNSCEDVGLSLALLIITLFQRRTSPSRKVGSSLTSTSSLGFPGGSLGWLGTSWLGCLSVGLLGHILDLVVLDN